MCEIMGGRSMGVDGRFGFLSAFASKDKKAAAMLPRSPRGTSASWIADVLALDLHRPVKCPIFLHLSHFLFHALQDFCLSAKELEPCEDSPQFWHFCLTISCSVCCCWLYVDGSHQQGSSRKADQRLRQLLLPQLRCSQSACPGLWV